MKVKDLIGVLLNSEVVSLYNSWGVHMGRKNEFYKRVGSR
jgi:hypothetical protein